MKAERRHELKENDLVHTASKAVKVMQLPDLRRKLIGRAVAIAAAIIVAALLIRMRFANAERSYNEASEHLSIAKNMLAGLKAISPSPELDAKFFDTVQMSAEQTNGEIDKVTGTTGDEKLLSQAEILRGDLNFYMANLPVGNAKSATQPAPGLRQSREEYLTRAVTAYQEVVDKYSEQPVSAIAAHFGLAAIMENRSSWEEAQKHYDAVLMNPESGPGFKAFAQARRNDIATLQLPLLAPGQAIAPLAPASQPATSTSTTIPATGAAKPQAAETGAPVATLPATKPATKPK